MASSSSASSPNHTKKIDVYLSFSGKDTGYTFTDHLNEALVRSGFSTFRHNVSINEGQPLQPEIETAIRQSRAFVIVLSQNYAGSRLCLDELALILELRRNFNHFVLPLFHGVDPSDARNQRGSFAITTIDGSEWTEVNVKRWKEALTKVGSLTGMLNKGPEADFITKIVHTLDSTLHSELAVYESLLANDKLQLLQLKDAKLSGLDQNLTELSETSLYRASMTSSETCRRFTFAEIQSVTNNFDDELVIGEGGFAKVYIGQINSEESKHIVAIKRLNHMGNQGAREFTDEIKLLSKLRYRHLVSLIGYCEYNKEMILVYEYMPRGTLHDHLQKAETPLSWLQRIKIAIGAAMGLDYLHNAVSTQHGIIHRDVKSANILLDEKWEAMIADFGVSKIGRPDHSLSILDTSVKGTFGYIDPDYFYTGQVTRKTDVYAFGVVLFELLSGMRAVDTRLEKDQCSLVFWARRCAKEIKLDRMVDSKIRGTIAPKCLKHFTQLADQCLLQETANRPTMTKVVSSLRDILELQEKYDRSSNSRFGF